MKYIVCAICCVVFSGCATQYIKTPKDIRVFPQDATYYLAKHYEVKTSQTKKLAQQYMQFWYSPWQNMRINQDTKSIFWVKGSLLKAPGYGENLRKNSLKSTKAIWDDMDIGTYPNAKIKAIIVNETNIRAAPTDMPRFNSNKGYPTSQSYPFDRWQNSLVFSGTPVLITHLSKSKQWAHIQTEFVCGWVRIEDLAYVSDKDITKIMSAKRYIMPYTDGINLYDKSGNFALRARIGQLFAVPNDNPDSVYVYYRKPNGFVQITLIKISRSDFKTFPQNLNPKFVAHLINTMMGDKYGWGGYLGNRDCSAFIRDIFAYFGLYLPRNSRSQVLYAKNMVNLKHFSRKQKERYIIENATPFGTLLWFNGHIMLYIGTYNNRVIVAHSAWSVETSKLFSKTHNMLGGVVISTLYVGKENNGISSRTMLIDKVQGMSDLYSYMTQ